MSAPLVLGLDGFTRGWACVAIAEGRVVEACGLPTLKAVGSRFPTAGVIGIDMPLALAATGRRPVDTAARAFLGARAGSVFFIPPEPVFEAETHPAAIAIARSLNEAAPSAQTFSLFKKIREAREAVSVGMPLYEVHPEVSFLAMGGVALPKKRSWNGHRARLRLLESAGYQLEDCDGDVPADDLLDAAAAAWSAARIAAGTALTLPAEPTPEERTANMLVWY